MIFGATIYNLITCREKNGMFLVFTIIVVSIHSHCATTHVHTPADIAPDHLSGGSIDVFFEVVFALFKGLLVFVEVVGFVPGLLRGEVVEVVAVD